MSTAELMEGQAFPPGRHQHNFEHTTQCLKGKAIVYIFHKPHEPAFTILNEGDPPLTLPANIDHEIRALVTPTVVENVGPGGRRGMVGGTRGEVMTGGPAHEASG